MEKLFDRYAEIFPDVSYQAVKGSVLNILQTVGNNQEVAIPTGKEEDMNELIGMAKEFIEAERVKSEELSESTSDEAVSEVE